jgi:acetyl-CoA carboxylase carboxyltransferase component
MNSKDLGADLTLAWPHAELGIMGAQQAVGLIHRRELAAAEDAAAARERRADNYAAQHLSARGAARRGHIDEVIPPEETRGRLAWALDASSARRGGCGRIRNIPL